MSNQQGITELQAVWAGEHDWYISSWSDDLGNNWKVEALERSTVIGDDGAQRVVEHGVTFTDFKALKAWAGY